MLVRVRLDGMTVGWSEMVPLHGDHVDSQRSSRGKRSTVFLERTRGEDLAPTTLRSFGDGDHRPHEARIASSIRSTAFVRSLPHGMLH